MLKKKKALVCSGGGNKASFSIGVLKALTEHGKKWDIIAGVSAGALNGAYLAMYKPEEQKIAIQNLEQIWKDISGNHDIYLPWVNGIFNYVAGFFKKSLYHTNPLRNLIQKHWNHEKLQSSGVLFSVGVVSLNSGLYKKINQNDEKLMDWILASSSFPIFLEPIKINNEWWVDGGIRCQTPLKDLVEHFDEIDEIDIVATHPLNGHVNYLQKIDNGFNKITKRVIQILTDEIYRADFLVQIPKHIKVNVYYPKHSLSDNSLVFNNAEMIQNINIGYIDTLNELKKENEIH